MIQLKEIDHNNWIQCIELEVTEEQRQYVNPNIFSLAETFVHSDANKKDADEYYRCIPFAIYSDDKMIGFALITYEKESDYDNKPIYELYRVMVDKRYQGKGYGKEAVKSLLEYIKTFPYGEVENIYVEWHPDNIASAKLFQSYGFKVVGTEDDGAIVAKLNIDEV